MSTKNRYVYEPPVRFRFPFLAVVLVVAVLFKLVHGFEGERPSQDAIQELPFQYTFRSLADNTSGSTAIFGDDLFFATLQGTNLENATKLQGPSSDQQVKVESIAHHLPLSVQHMESSSCLPKSTLDSRFHEIKEILARWRTDFNTPFITGQLYKMDLYAGLTMSASMQTYFHFCSKLTETNDFQPLPGAPKLQCARVAECFTTKNSLILDSHSQFISAVHEFVGLLAAFTETVECAEDSKECKKCSGGYEYRRPEYPPTPTTTTSTTWRSRIPGTNDDEVTVPTPNPSTSTFAPPGGGGSYHHPYGSDSCSEPCYCHVSKKVIDRYTSKLQKLCGDFNSISTKMTDSLATLKTSILPFWDCTFATMDLCQNTPGADCQLSFCKDLTDNSNIFANVASGYVDSFMTMWNIIAASFDSEIPSKFAGLFKA